jgi:hypothetical protein
MTYSSDSAVVVRPISKEITREKTESRALNYAVGAVYAVLVVVTILRHEPWSDEAQAWLLARDASLTDLWFHLLHYEGSPGLWQTLLHGLIRLGFPYAAYNFISGALGFVAACLFIRYAPLPPAIRLLVPFTYFICYQYAVVARSYSLMAPLLFGIAALYRQAPKRPLLFTTLICLMAGISVHGVMISACIWLPVAWRGLFGRKEERAPQWQWLAAGAIYGIVILLFMASAWPAKDVAFAPGRGLPNFTVARLIDVARNLATEAFTGDWLTSFAVIALSLPFLWRGGGALFFVPATALLWVFGVVVYSKEWHYGIVLLIWLFGMWISAAHMRVTRAALWALGIVIAIQCYWTVTALAYDWMNPYSGSAEAARYFQQHQLANVYAVGYPTTALQPYFPANLYSNINQGSRQAYWDWSKRNTANPENGTTPVFSARHRDIVLVGYRRDYEQTYWANTMGSLGYQRIDHFGGSLFWRNRVLEPEAYDLYRRIPGAVASPAGSTLNLGAKSSDAQILAGFYKIERNAWRWTAKQFSVVLRTPPFAARNGAKLVLRFYLPEAQINQRGPMTLTGDVDGVPLTSRTFTRGGQYEYSAIVPAEALGYDLVAVNLHFDKATVGLNGDTRELAAVASFIGLEVQ